jgi:hypothetical protein
VNFHAETGFLKRICARPAPAPFNFRIPFDRPPGPTSKNCPPFCFSLKHPLQKLNRKEREREEGRMEVQASDSSIAARSITVSLVLGVIDSIG